MRAYRKFFGKQMLSNLFNFSYHHAATEWLLRAKQLRNNFTEMSMPDDATKWYKDVLLGDGANIEAIASIAANYFYSDQPEIAIRLYR